MVSNEEEEEEEKDQNNGTHVEYPFHASYCYHLYTSFISFAEPTTIQGKYSISLHLANQETKGPRVHNGGRRRTLSQW